MTPSYKMPGSSISVIPRHVVCGSETKMLTACFKWNLISLLWTLNPKPWTWFLCFELTKSLAFVVTEEQRQPGREVNRLWFSGRYLRRNGREEFQRCWGVLISNPKPYLKPKTLKILCPYSTPESSTFENTRFNVTWDSLTRDNLSRLMSMSLLFVILDQPISARRILKQRRPVCRARHSIGSVMDLPSWGAQWLLRWEEVLWWSQKTGKWNSDFCYVLSYLNMYYGCGKLLFDIWFWRALNARLSSSMGLLYTSMCHQKF